MRAWIRSQLRRFCRLTDIQSPFDFCDLSPSRVTPPIEVFEAERFRVVIFRDQSLEQCIECGLPCRWLMVELHDGDEWKPILGMPESRLPLVQDVLQQVGTYLEN